VLPGLVGVAGLGSALCPPTATKLSFVASSAGDLVAARWRCTATHAGTGAKIADYVGVNFFRIADGKLVEIWDTRDDLGLFAQLGLVPPPTELLAQVYGPLAY
jgi:hypothetical protein